jgi:predicted nucleic acid-binding protein
VIVVDSSVWIAKFRGEAGPAVAKLDQVSDPTMLIVGDLVLFEILQGARDDQHAERIARALGVFNTMPLTDPRLASAAARHSRTLREKGVTIRKSIDLLIATFCLERDHALLHQDRDFDMIARHLPLAIA